MKILTTKTLAKKNFHPVLFTMIFLISLLNGFSQSKDVKAILDVMRMEEKYWNEGNIEGYVSLYAPSDSTRMILTTSSVYGRDSILAFYKKHWPKERMGKLKLESDSIEKINGSNYYVTGFFHVSYPDRKTIKGRFSGLMKKVKGKWYLYTDHAG